MHACMGQTNTHAVCVDGTNYYRFNTLGYIHVTASSRMFKLICDVNRLGLYFVLEFYDRVWIVRRHIS